MIGAVHPYTSTAPGEVFFDDNFMLISEFETWKSMRIDSGPGATTDQRTPTPSPLRHLTLISSISQPVPPSPIPPIPHNSFPLGKKPEKNRKNKDENLEKYVFWRSWCTVKRWVFTVHHGRWPWYTVKRWVFAVHQACPEMFFRSFFLRFQSSFFKVFSRRAPMGGLLFQDSS